MLKCQACQYVKELIETKGEKQMEVNDVGSVTLAPPNSPPQLQVGQIWESDSGVRKDFLL